jgi:hypothetical protein
MFIGRSRTAVPRGCAGLSTTGVAAAAEMTFAELDA